ncbi:CDP-diacylglycerol--glycerol-3-phosphate 3-phosphatidyltransferase [Pseudooceanicola sediminis]|uniref:CDP-diacylglycerol--glycerol-3-phosphate 3-phosphatidyltransferase n=1 Tax=Pseudooceanicola sediminis TaxID=2211117 RepID=A0A399J2D4_9RHOB|nr:CDP-diacylglycerol--glycerol-3-phosphate 3-phosphatidyltransferase [Pseudooceanicola sediminis]KAA2314574.1 CDP-diacylglycerol--glycerol-3-phosphate 3-phosphatidyltransferase [Puniceibacterium sp. HSS470]RII39470.1 CDP-diacylglycerol--glycerol-3-phosphate 3-phosphatidyltransferase [Pseudooceanicola sediminis]|tara:strand:- start:18499 stop:19161 length:663 start_codon:yes stop_codon:yes gene_type:complete
MTLTLPNLLTILRLLCAPGIALCFLLLPRPFADWWAVIIFILASATDWFDGYLARNLNQVSKLGTMLDPIADKAMVVIALMVLAHVSPLSDLLILPAAAILFREVFVSGLREYLGETAGLLKVTRLAKWKTTTQMVAIVVLLAQGIAEHHLGNAMFGLDTESMDGILAGTQPDDLNLRMLMLLNTWATWGGLALIWIAATLTLITGADYFLKARPHLKDE